MVGVQGPGSQWQVKMGKLFKKRVIQYRKKSSDFWDDMLKSPRIITDKEVKSVEDAVKNIRKEHGFRDVK